jgi:trk system potassium uptake protein TrkA
MKVIIMGCGRVGSQVATLLSHSGHDITVIDSDPAALAILGPEFGGRKIRGVGFDKGVLLEAGIENADAFVATSPSDNANVVAARIARNIFKVPRVIARLYDPRRAEIYQRLGLVTISTTTWGAERITELLTHSNLDPIFSFGGGEVALISLEVPSVLIGHQVKDIMVPGEVSVVSIVRKDESFIPIPGTEFCDKDLVYLAVLASSMDRLEAMLGN